MVPTVVDTSVVLMDRVDLSPVEVGAIGSIDRRWSLHHLYFFLECVPLEYVVDLSQPLSQRLLIHLVHTLIIKIQLVFLFTTCSIEFLLNPLWMILLVNRSAECQSIGFLLSIVFQQC